MATNEGEIVSPNWFRGLKVVHGPAASQTISSFSVSRYRRVTNHRYILFPYYFESSHLLCSRSYSRAHQSGPTQACKSKARSKKSYEGIGPQCYRTHTVLTELTDTCFCPHSSTYQYAAKSVLSHDFRKIYFNVVRGIEISSRIGQQKVYHTYSCTPSNQRTF